MTRPETHTMFARSERATRPQPTNPIGAALQVINDGLQKRPAPDSHIPVPPEPVQRIVNDARRVQADEQELWEDPPKSSAHIANAMIYGEDYYRLSHAIYGDGADDFATSHYWPADFLGDDGDFEHWDDDRVYSNALEAWTKLGAEVSTGNPSGEQLRRQRDLECALAALIMLMQDKAKTRRNIQRAALREFARSARS